MCYALRSTLLFRGLFQSVDINWSLCGVFLLVGFYHKLMCGCNLQKKKKKKKERKKIIKDKDKNM